MYYYYAYLAQKDAGASSAVAAAQAQKMAPVYAYEQLEHTFSKHDMEEMAKGTQVLPPLPALPLPPAGIALHSMQASAATNSRQRSQKKLGAMLVSDLLSRNGIDIEEDIPSVLLQVVNDAGAWHKALAAAASAMQSSKRLEADINMIPQTSHGHSFVARRQRSALRGVLLSVASGSR